MPRAGTKFTEWQDAVIISMKADGASSEMIGRKLKRTRGVIESRVHNLRLKGKLDPSARVWNSPNPSQEVLDEARRAYSHEQSLSARLCGDPLPGRSALDRRGR